MVIENGQQKCSSSQSGTDLLESRPTTMPPDMSEADIERINKDRSQNPDFFIELLNENEKFKKLHGTLESQYKQSQRDLAELREAYDKVVSEQKVSATTVFEKEVQLLQDNDTFTQARQEFEKELKQAKSQLEAVKSEKDTEKEELMRKLSLVERELQQATQQMKLLKTENKDLKIRETKSLNEKGELEDENITLQKQLSSLRHSQIEFESLKYEVQRLHDENVQLNSQLEEVVTLRRITERQMHEALEALQSEREQKYALREELDKKNSVDPLFTLTSLAAFKGSSRLADLALRNLGPGLSVQESHAADDDHFSSHEFVDAESFETSHDPEMPSIEGSLFDEIHLTEIKKLQQTCEEKENQRSHLNSKLIELQHKLESRTRQCEEIEKKLDAICSYVEEIYNEVNVASPTKTTANKRLDFLTSSTESEQTQFEAISDISSQDEVSSTTTQPIISSTPDVKHPPEASTTTPTTTIPATANKANVLDDFDNVYKHLQTLFAQLKSLQESHLLGLVDNNNLSLPSGQVSGEPSLNETQAAISSDSSDKSRLESVDNISSEEEKWRNKFYLVSEKNRGLRAVIKLNKDVAETASKLMKSKYEAERAINVETLTKLNMDLKRFKEDAAEYTSQRAQIIAEKKELHSEIEKLKSQLISCEQEKQALNNILKMSIEQKITLMQKLEALEMDREGESHSNRGSHNNHGLGARQAGAPRGRLYRGARGARGGGGGNGTSSRGSGLAGASK